MLCTTLSSSCLDFAFYTGLQNVTSKVIVRSGDFPDDNTTSDHRPVLATVTFDSGLSLFDREPENPKKPVMSYWLITNTGVRHNASCRNFGKAKHG